MFRCNRLLGHVLVSFMLMTMFVVALAVSPPVHASTEDGVVEFLVFTSIGCEPCVFLDDELLPRLEKKYGSRIKYEYIDVADDFDMFRAMMDLEAAYGYDLMALPQVYVGEDALLGTDEIKTSLEAVIDSYIARGGADMPELPEDGMADAGPPERGKSIYVTYFYSEGCRECDPISIELDYLARFNQNIRLRKCDISEPDGLKMNEALCDRADVPESERGVVPAVFVGYEYLVGDELTCDKLESVVSELGMTGTENVWAMAEGDIEDAESAVEGRFNSFNFLTVLGAGLLDGINPCAFTVIVFFISYLAFIGRSGRDILLIGIAFTAAIFATYFLIGLGLLSFVRYLGAAGRWVTLGVAVLAVLFGVASLYDYLRGRKKGEAQSTLGLPPSITRRIHKAIREKTKTRHFIAAAAVLGVIIAAMELGCTGQVYLPTITFVARIGGERAKAVLYLAAYNLMFIVPLLVVFAVAYAGTGSEKLVEFGKKHTNGLKLMMSVTFFALAALLFATL